jgi:hypothetical protein
MLQASTWESCGLLWIHHKSILLWPPPGYNVEFFKFFRVVGGYFKIFQVTEGSPVLCSDMGSTKMAMCKTRSKWPSLISNSQRHYSRWFHRTCSTHNGNPCEPADGTVMRLKGHLGNPAILRFFPRDGGSTHFAWGSWGCIRKDWNMIPTDFGNDWFILHMKSN